MKYIKLGSTGVDVSKICVGCMSYGAPDRGTHACACHKSARRDDALASIDIVLADDEVRMLEEPYTPSRCTASDNERRATHRTLREPP